jgi:SpoVK/Ycf46/Vps4 family AAA+-type ATPase
VTPPDPAVITALREALVREPQSVAVRLHLASLLIDAREFVEARDHLRIVLDARPRDPEAEELMARVSRESATSLDGTIAPPPEELLMAGEALEDERAIDAFLDRLFSEAGTRPQITLADVAGMEDVKRRLEMSFLGPMRNPDLRRMYGKSLRGGLLLYGPPGCGKTCIARAVAGELGANFFSVGLHDVLEMWLGASERNLHTIFETARRNTPCVLFLDEVDALGQKRSHLTRSGGRNVVAQLLTELDSVGADNEGVFVLGATNQPWDIDPALRRPGRFDRMLVVLPPDEAARAAILEFHLRDRPVGKVDLQPVAKATDGFSGADLRLLCESAAELALADSVRSGVARPIGTDDLKEGLRGLRASTRPWFETAKNYALFANDDGTFDDLLAYMRKRRVG